MYCSQSGGNFRVYTHEACTSETAEIGVTLETLRGFLPSYGLELNSGLTQHEF